MRLLKNILMILCSIISIILVSLTTLGIVWYSIPTLQLTFFGDLINSILSPVSIFWITISSGILTLLFEIFKYLLTRKESCKLKNFFLHFNSYVVCLIAISASVITFATLNPLIAEEVIINIPKKISIAVCLVGLIIFYTLSNKLKTVINRRIQSYETAKEMNTVGRGSIIFINFLKLFEIFFPEMLMLGLISLCLSWNVASYFVIILIASIIPMITNIICDLNIRNEIIKKNQLEKKLLVDQIANKIKGDM